MTCALLIDGETLGCHHAAALLDAVPPDAPVRRVHGAASRLNGWRAVPGLTPVHAEPGCNAADILIAAQASELLWRDGFRGFVLATGDGGLAQLAIRLREAGAHVTVAGERQAPMTLRAAAHRFVVLSAPAPAAPAPAAPAPAPPRSSPACATRSSGRCPPVWPSPR